MSAFEAHLKQLLQGVYREGMDFLMRASPSFAIIVPPFLIEKFIICVHVCHWHLVFTQMLFF